MKSYLQQNLFFAHLEAKDSTEVICKMANALYEANKVNAEYKDAVIAREEQFPTGLPSGEIAVAIPHTDVKYVKDPAIAFASLKEPVEFANMGVKTQKVKVKFVVMLAMKEPHSQVSLLQKLMALFQNQTFLAELLEITTADELYRRVADYFEKEEK